VKVTATLLKFGEESIPDVFGDVVRFAPGSLYTDDHQRVPLLVETHDAGKVAAGYADRIWTDGDTVLGEFTLLDTFNGQQAALELAADVRKDVSVGVLPDVVEFEDREDVEPHPLFGPAQRATITLADLYEVSLCLRGRMPSARVDAVSTDTPTPEGDSA
jgi:hypothetical protein